MKVTAAIEKSKKVINQILFSAPNGFTFECLVPKIQKVFEKRKIRLSKENIETILNEVLDNFYYAGLLLGNEKDGYWLNLPNHNPNNKEFEKFIDQISDRSNQL